MQTSAYEHFNDTCLHMVGTQTLNNSAYYKCCSAVKCNVLNDYFASVITIYNGVFPVFHPKVSCVQAYQQVEFVKYCVP